MKLHKIGNWLHFPVHSARGWYPLVLEKRRKDFPIPAILFFWLVFEKEFPCDNGYFPPLLTVFPISNHLNVRPEMWGGATTSNEQGWRLKGWAPCWFWGFSASGSLCYFLRRGIVVRLALLKMFPFQLLPCQMCPVPEPIPMGYVLQMDQTWTCAPGYIGRAQTRCQSLPVCDGMDAPKFWWNLDGQYLSAELRSRAAWDDSI